MPMKFLMVGLFLALPALAGETAHFYYVEQAALAKLGDVQLSKTNLSREEYSVARLLRGHQIERGNGMVLIVRKYSDVPGAYDADKFTKVSIELPTIKDTSPVKFDLSQLGTYFSTGGSGWANKGGLATSSLSGWMTMSKSGNAWDVEIDLRGDAEDFMFSRPSIRSVALKENFKAVEIKHEALTPWLGAAFPTHEWPKAAAPDKKKEPTRTEQ